MRVQTSSFRRGIFQVQFHIPLTPFVTGSMKSPLRKTLVTYCRGPYCADADEALILLSAYGYSVKRLEEGVAEWQEAGYRLVTKR